MALVDIVSIQSGKDEDRCVEGVSGYLSPLTVRYAYITLTGCQGGEGFTMRLECNDTGFVWRDRDGAIEKQLELTRPEINIEDLTTTAVTVYDSVRVGDELHVVFRRPGSVAVTRCRKGSVARVLVMI